MPAAIHLTYRQRPSLHRNLFCILVSSAWRRKRRAVRPITIPDISAELRKFRIAARHLQAFNQLCQIHSGFPMSLVYPMTLVFPLFQRLLGLRRMPVSVFFALAKRLRISQLGNMEMERPYDLICRRGEARIVPKGFEMDLSAVIESRGNPIWEAVETFYYRGDYGIATHSDTNNSLEPIPAAPEIRRWNLSGRNGFRFARICGDGNPIHYSNIYARMFGFECGSAQPFLILGHALQYVTSAAQHLPLYIDVNFKGPVYYTRDIILKAQPFPAGHRFDLLSDGNPRPCMTGLLGCKERSDHGELPEDLA
jgi:hypothetical protein